jgi:hypothetical protein
MASPFFYCIHGKLVIVGYEPDGDSVRFIADDATRYQALTRAELHYGTAAQPLGDTARDALLGWIGFTAIEFDKGQPTKVTAAEPVTVRAAILAQMVEVNGRPVAYVLVETADALPADGDWVDVDRTGTRRPIPISGCRGRGCHRRP